MTGPVALAHDREVEQAAQKTLSKGGGAVDAVIAGFLCAAALRPGVLLGPMVALVAGIGSAARCIDGRALQPGQGAPRPRGALPEQPIAAAARAALAPSLSALTLLHAYGARHSMGQLVKAPAQRARKLGATRRAEALVGFGRAGASWLRQADVARVLLASASAMAGGMLTMADIDRALPDDEAPSFEAVAGVLEIATPSWQTAIDGPAPPSEGIVVADGRGSVATLSFSSETAGLALKELELQLPLAAAPVVRGVSRVTPGTRRSTCLPIAVLRREGWYGAATRSGNEPLLQGDGIEGDETLAALAEALVRGDGEVLLAGSTAARKKQRLRTSSARAGHSG